MNLPINTKKLNIYFICRYILNFGKRSTINTDMGNSASMTQPYSKDQLDKIGNTLRFLTSDSSQPKTKILKMIYLLEEASIKKYGVPFFNIPFEVWQFGPVPRPIYTSLHHLFQDYIDLSTVGSAKGDVALVTAKGEFNDDEFSDNDLEILSEIKQTYSKESTDNLVNLTHKEGSPWHIAAVENNLLDQFNRGKTSTEHLINLESVIESSILKEIYQDYKECHGDC